MKIITSDKLMPNQLKISYPNIQVKLSPADIVIQQISIARLTLLWNFIKDPNDEKLSDTVMNRFFRISSIQEEKVDDTLKVASISYSSPYETLYLISEIAELMEPYLLFILTCLVNKWINKASKKKLLESVNTSIDKPTEEIISGIVEDKTKTISTQIEKSRLNDPQIEIARDHEDVRRAIKENLSTRDKGERNKGGGYSL